MIGFPSELFEGLRASLAQAQQVKFSQSCYTSLQSLVVQHVVLRVLLQDVLEPLGLLLACKADYLGPSAPANPCPLYAFSWCFCVVVFSSSGYNRQVMQTTTDLHLYKGVLASSLYFATA